METPNFFSIIPANVRYDQDLKPNEKLLYSEITALSNKCGYCFADNQYFSDLYGVSDETVSRWVSHLKECGYITVDYEKMGTKIIRRHIGISMETANILPYRCEKDQQPIDKKINGAIDKKIKDNNTSINNTRVNILPPIPPVHELFERFWSAYPKKVAKPVAEKAFQKLNPSAELGERILSDIELRKTSKDWTKDGGQYIPNPSTYLNQRRWEDEIQMPRKKETSMDLDGYEEWASNYVPVYERGEGV